MLLSTRMLIMRAACVGRSSLAFIHRRSFVSTSQSIWASHAGAETVLQRGLRSASREMSSRGEGAQTIFAMSSGAGRAGVAIIRISGPDAHRAITSLHAGSFVFVFRASVSLALPED